MILLIAAIHLSNFLIADINIYIDKWNLISSSGQKCSSEEIGAQGSTSVEDCLENCFVDSECKYGVHEENGQCYWLESCNPVAGTGNRTIYQRIPKSFPEGYTWSSAYDQAKTVLFKRQVVLPKATRICASTPNCTSFYYVDPNGPAITNKTYDVTFLDDNPFVDASQLYDQWLYQKVPDANPYCDMKTAPDFAATGVNTTLELSWSNCAGPNISALLVGEKGIVQKVSLAVGNAAILTVPSSAILGSTAWEVVVVTQLAQLYYINIPILNALCVKDGVWPATRPGTVTQLNCWDVDLMTYAAGQAFRICQQDGNWQEAVLDGCSNGGNDKVVFNLLNNKEVLYDITSNVWGWIFYFPGNKYYGYEIDWGDFHVDCKSILPEAWDIPGNMVDTTTRRLQLVGWKQDWQHSGPGPTCDKWSWKVLISIFDDNAYYINDWISMTGDKEGNITLTTNSTRLGWQISWNEWHEGNLAFITSWDKHENACLQSLHDHCGRPLPDKHECEACALFNIMSLTYCSTDGNLRQTVYFWCTCREEDDCAGPEYPANITKNWRANVAAKSPRANVH